MSWRQGKTIDCRGRGWLKCLGWMEDCLSGPWENERSTSEMSWYELGRFYPNNKLSFLLSKRLGLSWMGVSCLQVRGLDLLLYCSIHFKTTGGICLIFFFSIPSHVLLKEDFYTISSFKIHQQVRSTISLNSGQGGGCFGSLPSFFPKNRIQLLYKIHKFLAGRNHSHWKEQMFLRVTFAIITLFLISYF